ncbi:SIR2 family protein [Niabella sp. 22666]|uniref:SIR2 family protein n=1 Tax=Niabella sp. 22666 TaxID=3453954 RepID=UPI003F849FB7
MDYFDLSRNKIFFGNTDKLSDWIKENPDNQSKVISKVKLMLKNYLELDNVSFLFGSGTSIHLGAVAIRNFPKEVEDHIDLLEKGLPEELHLTIEELQAEQLRGKKDKEVFKDDRGWEFIVDGKIVRDNDSKEIAIEYEEILNYLIAKDFVLGKDKSKARTDKISELIVAIKEGLFNVCNLEKREVSKAVIERKKKSSFVSSQAQGELLENNTKYIFHEKFIKALLQRPLNLRRANIFTANYDLAFEYAFDKLGVHYIDGFTGFHKRFFKPETFDYDIFYPGSTTSGKVQRIEKVVRYFKLHGSLSWVNSEARDANNLYGIEEKPLELIDSLDKKGEIIIYPSAVKKSYTLDFPYSELFRQFAATITQPQSVLITIGYSFADEHFNDIIYQALSNPTFTLIIVDFAGTRSPYIKNIKELNDPRIIILEGEFFGDFLTFADTLMPNFNNIDHYDDIASTLNNLLSNNSAPLITEAENNTPEA